MEIILYRLSCRNDKNDLSFFDRPGWVEGACAPVVAVSLLYSYHPVPLDEEVSLLVGKRNRDGFRKFVGTPPKKSFGGVRKGDFISNPTAELAPDILHLEIDIGPLSIVAYGAITKLFLAIKVSDWITIKLFCEKFINRDISSLHSVCLSVLPFVCQFMHYSLRKPMPLRKYSQLFCLTLKVIY